jgi:hypothetical protein
VGGGILKSDWPIRAGETPEHGPVEEIAADENLIRAAALPRKSEADPAVSQPPQARQLGRRRLHAVNQGAPLLYAEVPIGLRAKSWLADMIGEDHVLAVAGRIRQAIDYDKDRFRVWRRKQVVHGIGLQRAAIHIEVIIVRRKPDSIIVYEIIALLLKEVIWNDVSADVVDPDTIHVAVLPFIPVANLTQGLTDRKLTSASGRIEELDEDDLAGKIAEPHRRIGRIPTRVRKRRPRV